MADPALNLVVLSCADLAKSKAFFEALGLAFVDEKHGQGPAHLSATMGSLVLELYPATAKHPPDRTGLGFTITDLDGTLAALRAIGAEIRTEPGATATRSAVVTDPDGRRVEIAGA